MGQAKRNVAALRKAMLADVGNAMRAPSALETELASLIPALAHEKVVRIDAEKLAWMRMKPRECHENCRFYAGQQPDAAWVVGWWDQGDAWTLHSVVRLEGGLGCLTPMLHADVPRIFMLAPDPDIVVDIVPMEASMLRCDVTWRGRPLQGDLIVRKDLDAMIRTATALRADLLAGLDPHEAQRRLGRGYPTGS